MGDLLPFSERVLQEKFDDKTGSWLYLIARGIDLEAITPRFYSKSIGYCKKFPGKTAITGLKTLMHWFLDLGTEINDRLEKDIVENNRKAKQMVVSFTQEINGEDICSSRSVSLVSYDAETIANIALETLKKCTDQFLKPNNDAILNNPIKFLGISAGKFDTLASNTNTLQKLFQNQIKKHEAKLNCSEHEFKDQEDDKLTDSDDKEEVIDTSRSFFAAYLNNKRKSNENNQTEIVEKRVTPDLQTSNFLTFDEEKQKSVELNTSTSELFATSAESNQINYHSNRQYKYESLPSTSMSNSVKPVLDAMPESIDEKYVTCDKCGKNILVCSLQTHLDFHLALTLSHEQREEFRENLKSEINSQPIKKLKVNTTNKNCYKKNVPTKSINEFLKKQDQNVNNIEDGTLCEECCTVVPKSKYLEHIDFHVAKKLSSELNRIQVVQKNITPGTEKKANSKVGTSKSIKAYFHSQN